MFLLYATSQNPYLNIRIVFEGTIRFELMHNGFADHCVTTSPHALLLSYSEHVHYEFDHLLYSKSKYCNNHDWPKENKS